ncbi:MAG TPA: prolyl oligopeptidase family serine peptidase [Thermodesulfobacteriota bacterium]|nr:prolyl oligopeptidase family serine peptidase [Thermodesulfobacteriota bacterium]
MIKHAMMRMRTLTLFTFLLTLALPAAAAPRVETGFLDREITLGSVSYRYQVYVPVNYVKGKALPVILFLHGAGEGGEDGLLQTQVGLGPAIRQARDRFPFIVVFPQARRGHFWTGEMATLALKTLDQTVKEFNGDSQRLYVTGISLGGFGTWVAAARAPGKFAAIVPICGFVNVKRPDLPAEGKAFVLPDNPFDKSPDPYVAAASQISKVPTWIFHGSADPVVSPDESRKMFQALKASGFDVKYTEYDGVGHDSWDRAYAEPDLIPWLLSHRRSQP